MGLNTFMSWRCCVSCRCVMVVCCIMPLYYIL